jgi:hypothetical protein
MYCRIKPGNDDGCVSANAPRHPRHAARLPKRSRFVRCCGLRGGSLNSRAAMITCVRSLAVHHNAHIGIYRALEERGLALAFHACCQLGESGSTATAAGYSPSSGTSWYNSFWLIGRSMSQTDDSSERWRDP